ncbi:branched-chain amino acid ABC transporter permease [Bradyrhizobium jicamae]|uniref:branched-chain amino acid ABC transporter permease n=1 Tax=Bradyrhizobium jicamae TaxID=280332 RepID=UPI001BA921C7|nr:branched-chain amino acid ABC transporter permease [Bradyrhizobium jicamae]MBR0932219.1 branched-chain amino acid ABC transporter permease [Bradyrhizobium jicamae]
MLYRETGQFKSNYAEDMAIFPIRQDGIALGVLLAVAFIGVPLLATLHVWPFGTDYLLWAILLPFLILALAAIGTNILVGYCGQISLGSGAFMAIGAYSAYKLATGVHIPLAWLGIAITIPPLPVLASILLGGLAAAGFGIAFGIPSLRIKGLYLAVATLAAQFFFDWVFLRVPWFTNYAPSGSVNAPELNFFGVIVQTPIQRYLLCLTFVTVIAIMAKNLVRGNLGRQWMAIRDMDIAAELIGIRPLYAKLTAFAVSSFIVGVAGALWAFVYLGSWEPLAFSIDRSLDLLFMVIIGGLGSIMGSFVGAAFVLIVPVMLNLIPAELGVPLSTQTITHLQFIIFGSLICYLLIKEPRGFARLISIGKEKLRLWPFPY